MGGRTASPRPEKGDDENVQQEKGRQPEQRDHPCERAVPTVLSQGGGDGAAVRRRHRAAAAPNTRLREHRGLRARWFAKHDMSPVQVSIRKVLSIQEKMSGSGCQAQETHEVDTAVEWTRRRG